MVALPAPFFLSFPLFSGVCLELPDPRRHTSQQRREQSGAGNGRQVSYKAPPHALWEHRRKCQLFRPALPLISSENGCCSWVPGEPKVWAEGFLEKSSQLPASQQSPQVTSDTPPGTG